MKQELIDLARDSLFSLRTQRDSQENRGDPPSCGCTNYSVLYEGTEITSIDAWCHLSLGEDQDISYYEVFGNPYAIIDLMHRGCGDDDAKLFYFDWVLNRSIYRDAFVTKDAQDVIDNGVIVRTDKPACYMVGALIMLRMLGEFKENAREWYRLVQGGVKEPIAFLFAYYISTERGVSIETEHHYAFDPGYFNEEALRAFYRGDLPKLDLPPWYEKQVYRPLSRALNGLVEWEEDFTKHIERYFPGPGTVKKCPITGENYKEGYNKNTIIPAILEYQEKFNA